ncbi:hypothetical protein C7957_1402 [Halanaerobium saccharolyticum]|jgi:hypothetical protein|uniref:Uncharacterized protein n=1 Tax=Halanaerobium saccharolyticum TaxID=43595 RepID=A0A4R6RGY2_9FIRM|nr:hypothetical protein [Halanaerobium saccharolyticum]TDP85633.1 hypothetical protein C7957_1402 [Halanaerobium saccharolyticum]
MTEAVTNELELTDILPSLLNRELFTERKIEEMNEKEKNLINKIEMEVKLDKGNFYQLLEGNIFEGKIYFDDFNNFLYGNNDEFYEKLAGYYKQDNLLGIDLILLKRQIDIFEKIDQSLDYFWNIAYNVLPKEISGDKLSGDEWYFLKNIRKKYSKIYKYKSKVDTITLYYNLRKLSSIDGLKINVDDYYYRELIDSIKNKIRNLLDNEKDLLKIKNGKLDYFIENTVVNLLKENKTVEEIAELTDYPEVLIEIEKDKLNDE